MMIRLGESDGITAGAPPSHGNSTFSPATPQISVRGTVMKNENSF